MTAEQIATQSAPTLPNEAQANPSAPSRRSTDLPPDSPWWERWIAANIHHFGSGLYAAAGVAAEFYATYPDEVNKAIEQTLPAGWGPHILAGALLLTSIWRIAKRRR